MSSHRDSPATAADPTIDSTDLYAFRSPDDPTTVTLIVNYIPFQTAGGPSFAEFAEDVRYSFHISNQGTAGEADITYTFKFKTTVRNAGSSLYATAPLTTPTGSGLNRLQSYTVTRTAGSGSPVTLASDLSMPPNNVSNITTPNYQAALAQPAAHSITGGRTVFAGQRADPYFGDLGSFFDLYRMRPFQSGHLYPTAAVAGVDATATFNVHTIALKVPITDLLASSTSPVIGVWATANRQRVTIRGAARRANSGPWVQVSRIGNPFVNSWLVPMGKKDRWNTSAPSGDGDYASFVAQPEVAKLLPAYYPGYLPNLDAFNTAGNPRTDLSALLLTGAKPALGFNTYTGSTQADMLRLNTSVAPTTVNPNPLGVLAGDAAGFPNGRRVADDVTTIMIRSLAGQTIPLTYPSYAVDGAAAALRDGSSYTGPALLSAFPYVGAPWSAQEQPK